jgi:hypothetical protein
MECIEQQGKNKLAGTIKRASPVAWQEINLKGEYLFAEGGETLDIGNLMAPIEDYMPVPEKY